MLNRLMAVRENFRGNGFFVGLAKRAKPDTRHAEPAVNLARKRGDISY